jgi:hypothetical protein
VWRHTAVNTLSCEYPLFLIPSFYFDDLLLTCDIGKATVISSKVVFAKVVLRAKGAR